MTGESTIGAAWVRERRPLGGVGVLGRAWAGAVGRSVAGGAVSGRAVSGRGWIPWSGRATGTPGNAGTAGAEVGGTAGAGRPRMRMALPAFRRDDQTARRVDGGRGEDPFSVGVDEVTWPGPAARDVGAGVRALTLGRASRDLGRTGRAWSCPTGTRRHRSRAGRAGREPSGRERPCSRPVNGRLSGRSEVSGRSVLTLRAVGGRAELPARYRLARQSARTELTGLGEWSRRSESARRSERAGRSEHARRDKLPGRRSAIRHARAGHELAGRYHPGWNGTGPVLLVVEGHGSAGTRVAGRELALRGHPGRKWPAGRVRPGRHRTARKLTLRRSRIAGLHPTWCSRSVEAGRAGTARAAGTTRSARSAGAAWAAGPRELT